MIGRRNVYICTSGHRTVTLDSADGLTPYITSCRHPGCYKLASSNFYHVESGERPTHEWQRARPESPMMLRAIAR